MIRLAVLLACLAAPAPAEITRSECIDMLASSERLQSAARTPLIRMSNLALNALHGPTIEEGTPEWELWQAANALFRAHDDEWEAFEAALSALCRDRL